MEKKRKEKPKTGSISLKKRGKVPATKRLGSPQKDGEREREQGSSVRHEHKDGSGSNSISRKDAICVSGKKNKSQTKGAPSS